jgi:hypothetical protein
MNKARLQKLIAIVGFVFFRLPSAMYAAEGPRIVAIEPTPLFPKAGSGEPLRQLARLKLENRGPALEARATIVAIGQPAYSEPLGRIEPGMSVKEILFLPRLQPVWPVLRAGRQ